MFKQLILDVSHWHLKLPKLKAIVEPKFQLTKLDAKQDDHLDVESNMKPTHLHIIYPN